MKLRKVLCMEECKMLMSGDDVTGGDYSGNFTTNGIFAW